MRVRVVAWMLCGVWATVAVAAERLNVVVIVADDLGAMDLGCTGSKYHRTPQLDALAKEGLRFTQAYAACPVCSPSRAAIMTGKWPARLHLTDWLPGRGDLPAQSLARPQIHQELPLDEVTLAERFRSAGYVTGHIGKWHLGGEGFSPLDQGFVSNVAGDQTGTPLSYFAPFRKNKRTMSGLEDAPDGEYLTDRLATEAEKFLDRNKAEPFFLYLPHYAVHTPIQAPADHVAKFPAARPFTGQQNNPTYAAMLEALDTAVGRVRQKLADLGLLDKTVIVFTSDNGGLSVVEGNNTPATSNAPLREGKGWLYEGGIRVPCIVRGPAGLRKGETADIPICGVDLTATLCELCGLAAPEQSDGVSFAGFLKGGAAPAARSLYWHYPHYANQGGRPGGVVRDGRWKLIEFYEDQRRELYDLEQDRSENRNLSLEHPQEVERLAKQLDGWRAAVAAQSMTPNPAYRPHPPNAQGRIDMHARNARVQGLQLRYEPFPHKNTLGYWVVMEDSASWEFTLTKPGKYQAEGLIGCGNGSGGSVVEVTVGMQTLSYTVKETGGFQAFVPTPLGEFTFAEPGRYTVTLRAVKKPGVAVMDIRMLSLIPQ